MKSIKEEEGKEVNQGEVRVKKELRRKSTEKSFAQIVRGKMNGEKEEEEWKGQQMWVKEGRKEWLENSLVGRVNSREDLDKVKESFILNGIGYICLRYLGNKVILLLGEEGVDVLKAVKENKK